MLPFIILVLLFGSLPNQTQASHNLSPGTQTLKKVRNNPCRSITYHPGGPGSIPKVYCSGWKGANAAINTLVRGWDIQPRYPIAHIPFYLGVGIDPSSASRQTALTTIEKATWKDKIRFHNLRTELRLVPIKITGDFNGQIGDDPSIGFWGFWTEDDPKPNNSLTRPETSSVADLNGYYSLSGSGSYVPGVDTATLYLFALTSSYHAENPSSYKGEPAYRLEVTSHYMVEARTSWDAYQEWIQVTVGEKSVCSPGPNSQGFFECFIGPGNIALHGHYTKVPIKKWMWSQRHEDESGKWVPIATVSTNKVRWPDGSIHDHIPILVYQSQPLLQKP